MRLLVSGGRDFHDVEFIVYHLERVHAMRPVECLIAGGAKGVDTYCELWANELGIKVDVYPADWDQYRKAAGHIRNVEMFDKSDPDMAMVFPGQRGTKHMLDTIIEADCSWVSLWVSERVLFQKSHPKYGFLSNFASGYSFVDNDGLIWDTSEHYYQAQKTLNEEIRSEIQMASSPAEAKRLGDALTLRPGWSTFRLKAMRRALELKFAEGSKAAQLLLETEDSYLIEDTPWGDTFWGQTHGLGENHLGKMLMERRETLRQNTPIAIWHPISGQSS